MDPLTRLLAKSEIHEVLMRYARGVDRHDYELVRSCYYEDAVDDHGDCADVRDKFIAFLDMSARALSRSTHFLGNFLAEFSSDTAAIVETYFISNIVVAAGNDEIQEMLAPGARSDGPLTLLVQGRYIDRFEKRADQWLIAGRQVAYDSSAYGLTESPLSKTWTYGRQDAQDPVFVIRAGAGIK